jgi:hypothetical protein
MSELQVLQQFKNQLITFFDELISQFPSEPDLIIIRIFLKDQVSIKDVLIFFVHKLLTVRDMIKERKEEFFLDNNSLFQSLSKGKVNHFKKLWMSGRLDDEDKAVVWKWVDSFVFLADKYQKIMQTEAIPIPV